MQCIGHRGATCPHAKRINYLPEADDAARSVRRTTPNDDGGYAVRGLMHEPRAAAAPTRDSPHAESSWRSFSLIGTGSVSGLIPRPLHRSDPDVARLKSRNL